MKYILNKKEIDIKLRQETISDNEIDFHHSDFINTDMAWYGRGYAPVSMSNGFLKNIRNKTFQYINQCVENALSGTLTSLPVYHKCVSSDEDHRKVLKQVGKTIEPGALGIDVDYLAQKIKRACRFKLELDCLDVCDIRIFRPYSGSSMDNNPLHRDTWLPVLNNCINVYIPVAGNTRLSSLSLIPGSHLWNRKEIERTASNARINGIQYGLPSVTDIKRKFRIIRPALTNKEVLLFSSNLIHGGAVNLNKDLTRVSIEIRFWPKEKKPKRF